MARTVCVIQGHPDPEGGHFNHALSEAYENGLAEGGHTIRRITIADLDIPLLRDPADFQTDPPEHLLAARQQIVDAHHTVVLFPIWLGGMPAAVRAFFEQICRGGFAARPTQPGWPKGMLSGRSARVIVTMGMPATSYRWLFGAHGVRGFERSVLGQLGFKPVRETLIGKVESLSEAERDHWLARLRRYGRLGA